MSNKRRSMWKLAKYSLSALLGFLVLLALLGCFARYVLSGLAPAAYLNDEDLKFRDQIAVRLHFIGNEVELRTLVNRPWEKVCVVVPYNNVEEVEYIFEIKFREHDVTWSYHESFWGLVFVQEGEYFQILVQRDFGYDYVGERMRCWQDNADRPILLVRTVVNRKSGFSLERRR